MGAPGYFQLPPFNAILAGLTDSGYLGAGENYLGEFWVLESPHHPVAEFEKPLG